LVIFEVRDFKVLVISSKFGSNPPRLEEEGNSSLCFFLFLYDLFFNFCDSRILDSTSIATYCMENKVVDLISLNRRENYASNASSNVILAKDSVGLISSGILLYIYLKLFVKSDTDSPLFL
jgi:hypothetical protein